MLLTAMTTGKPAMSKITKTLDIQSLRLLLAQIANHFSFEEKVQILSVMLKQRLTSWVLENLLSVKRRPRNLRKVILKAVSGAIWKFHLTMKLLARRMTLFQGNFYGERCTLFPNVYSFLFSLPNCLCPLSPLIPAVLLKVKMKMPSFMPSLFSWNRRRKNIRQRKH